MEGVEVGIEASESKQLVVYLQNMHISSVSSCTRLHLLHRLPEKASGIKRATKFVPKAY